MAVLEVDAVATIERSLLAVDADDAATAVDISSLASSTAALSLTVGQQTLLMLAAAAGLERCCEALLRVVLRAKATCDRVGE